MKYLLYSRHLRFCSLFGNECGESVHLCPHDMLVVYLWLKVAMGFIASWIIHFIVFHVVDGWNEAIYLRCHFFFFSSQSKGFQRGYKVQWFHVVSLLCCFPYWWWSMTYVWRGFKLYRLTVYTRVHFTLPCCSFLSLCLCLWSREALLCLYAVSHNPLPGWFWNFVPWFKSHVQTHNVLSNEHPFHRTLFSPPIQLFFDMFGPVSSPLFLYSNDYYQCSCYCCFCM